MLARSIQAAAMVGFLAAFAFQAHAGDKPVAAQSPSTQPASVTDQPQPDMMEIPLQKVHAYQMPGTQALEITPAIAGGPLSNQCKLTAEILSALKDCGSDIRGGFTVCGAGEEALIEAHKVLVQGQSPASSLDRNQKMSLIFFSNQPGLQVHLKQIKQKGAVVEIAYQFVPAQTKSAVTQLAIIPLENIPSGTLQIILRSQPNPQLPTIEPHELAGNGQPDLLTFDFLP